MKTGLALVGILALFAANAQATSRSMQAEPANPAAFERPNVISVEGLGRGLAYSLSYDRSFLAEFTAGIGFSIWSGTTRSAHLGPNTHFTFFSIPVYGNYYFYNAQGHNRVFLTAGVAYGNISGNDPDTGLAGAVNGVYAPVGVGYEFISPRGYLLRIAPYVIISRNTSLWVGFTIGAGLSDPSG